MSASATIEDDEVTPEVVARAESGAAATRAPAGGRGDLRRISQGGGESYVVGVLTQANFGSREELVIRGRQLGIELAGDNPMEDTDWLAPAPPAVTSPGTSSWPSLPPTPAHSTAESVVPRRDLRHLDFLAWTAMDVLYEAVVQATEEAVINVLVASDTMTGRDGQRSPGFPNDVLLTR